ncbi:zinc ribbon domain-containing protein [Geothrix sp. PMB-07]|uniref:zinc ribbon domain-containing protein n=1 Tax=Geothrix sp. PMB-07 TaxID=3068640 RepID=UPI0027427AF7|nr:zinc ribbon domain-containing protein [Geothrix sp. PMB-07]WLT30269.1 zinc ribbon domain-containing protein [Geothrix sp. PMB-07]
MEAQVLRCSGCGASVPPDAIQCPYCQAQLATVACPSCFALVPLSATHCPGCGAAVAPRASAVPAGAACPACAKPLASAKVGELDLQECLACGGLWLDRTIFEQLGASRERQGAVLGALPAPAAPPVTHLEAVQYRPCPACAQRMNRVNYARRSGVVLDVCKAHGVWFDKDELRRVLAFVADGGLDRARELELEELKEAKRQAAVQVPLHPSSSYEFRQQMNAQGHWLSTVGLLGLAAEVAELFLDRT